MFIAFFSPLNVKVTLVFSLSWIIPQPGFRDPTDASAFFYREQQLMDNPILVGGLVAIFFFPYLGLLIIPIDELHHFSEGWLNHQPVLMDSL